MDRIKGQIEGQIQEIVFYGSVILSFSLFLSGILYMTLNPSSLVFILGQFGGALDQGLFTVFGYGFFYLAVMALHMGYVTNFHIYNFKDFKREYPVLVYSVFAHLLILSLFSTLLTVFQVYLEIPSSEAMSHGAGGMVGSLFGAHFYSALGIYGSLLILLALKMATAIAAGFFDIPDVLVAIKTTSKTTQHVTVKSAKTVNSILVNAAQFFLKGHEFSEATVMSAQHTGRILSRSINKANHLFTEHFHIYRDESVTPAKEEKAEKKDKKADKKPEAKTEKPVVKVEIKPLAKKAKSTSAMASKSEKLMNSLKELKKFTSLRKPVTVKPVEKASKKKTPAVKAKKKK